jgi:hypothetical protein
MTQKIQYWDVYPIIQKYKKIKTQKIYLKSNGKKD